MTLSLLLAFSPAIPHDFLLMEPAARKPPVDQESGYTISNKLKQRLLLNPCGRRPESGRVAARGVHLWTSAPSGVDEQLVLYRSARAAHAAFTRLREDAGRCRRTVDPHPPKHPVTTVWRTSEVRVGDESTGLGFEIFQDGSANGAVSGVVARRGKALMIYAQTAQEYPAGRVTKQARKMAAKVCELPGVC